jgi:hypothetical protein
MICIAITGNKLVCLMPMHCNTENWKQIFPEKEYRSHSPNFHIEVSVIDYIFPPSINLFCCRKYVDQFWEDINRS